MVSVTQPPFISGPVVLPRLRQKTFIFGFAGPAVAVHDKCSAKAGPHLFKWFAFVAPY